MKQQRIQEVGETPASRTGEKHRPVRSGWSWPRVSSVVIALFLVAATLAGIGVGASSPAAANGSGFSQYVPKLKEAKYNGTYVSLKWDLLSNQKGVNISRNGTYIKSLNASESATVWNDRDGKAGNVYQIVAYSHDNTLSKKSNNLTATSGGEVSGVKNLRVSKQSSRSVKLTWAGTSTAVKQWRIYRGDKLWRTVWADQNNPGKTYTYTDLDSTTENAPVYWIRPVGETGIVGNGSALASPIALEFLKKSEKDSRNFASRNKSQRKAYGGRTEHSRNLAETVNDARTETANTGASAGQATTTALVAAATAATSRNPIVIAAAIASVAWAYYRVGEFEDAVIAQVGAEIRYNDCMNSSACRDGVVRRPTDDNSSDRGTSPTSGNSGREPDLGTSHTGTGGV